jgi:UvrB/uvrC motif
MKRWRPCRSGELIITRSLKYYNGTDVSIHLLSLLRVVVISLSLALPSCYNSSAAAHAGVNDLATSLSLDPETAAVLREVAARKEQAVRDEDFPRAKKLKLLQDAIKDVGATLGRLVTDKQQAVADEDYDRAAELKDEILRIRAGLEEKMIDAGLRAPPQGPAGRRFNNNTNGPMGGGGGGYNSARGAPPPDATGYADRRGADSYGAENTRGPAPPSYGYGSGGSGAGIGYDSYGGAGSNSPGGPSIVDDRPIRPAPGRGGPPAPHPDDEDNAGGYGSDSGAAGGGPTSAGSPRSVNETNSGPARGFGGPGGGRPGSRALRPAGPHISLEEAISKDIPVPQAKGIAPINAGARRPLSGGAGPGDDGSGPADTGRSGADDGGSASAAGGDDETSGAGGGGPAGYNGPRADAVALSGVDGAGDLPAPEPLTVGAAKEAGALIDLFGMYVAQCFYSKHWSLREAAVKKMALELPKLASSQAAPPQAIFAACIHTATLVTAREKIAHVFVAVATQLIPSLLQACNLRRGEAVGSGGGSPLDSLMLGLADKLGDNTPRIRDAAIAALLSLAKHESVGCGFVVGHIVRRMTKKQASSIRSLQSRLQLCAQLIDQAHALSPIGGLSPDMLVHYWWVFKSSASLLSSSFQFLFLHSVSSFLGFVCLSLTSLQLRAWLLPARQR